MRWRLGGSDDLSPVGHHQAAIQPLLYLHLGMGVAPTLEIGEELEASARKADRVVPGHLPLVLEAQHPIQVQP